MEEITVDDKEKNKKLRGEWMCREGSEGRYNTNEVKEK